MATLALGMLLVTAKTSFACTVAADCDDGNPCDGVETCDVGTGQCLPGTPLICDDGNPCTTDTCDPSAGCLHVVPGTGLACLLSTIDAPLAQAFTLLRSTPAGQFSCHSTKHRLVRYVVTMRRVVRKLDHRLPQAEMRVRPEAARVGLFGARCRGCKILLSRLCVVSNRFQRLVGREVARGTIKGEVAHSLVALALDCGESPPPVTSPPNGARRGA